MINGFFNNYNLNKDNTNGPRSYLGFFFFAGLFDEDQTDNSTLGVSGNATLSGVEEGAKNKTFVLRLPKHLMKKLIRRFGVKDGEENQEEKYVTVLATPIHGGELEQQHGMGMWEGGRRRHHGRRRSHRNRVFLISKRLIFRSTHYSSMFTILTFKIVINLDTKVNIFSNE